MSSDDRPPAGGSLNLNDDAPSGAVLGTRAGRRGEVVSLAALWTARLLRLRPRHGPRLTGQRVRDSLELPRWALSLGFLLFILLFLAMLAFFFVSEAAAGDSVNFDKPTKDWYAGPVRYIITHQEVKAYKALDNEVDRQNFIDWFWQRRDIDPSTPPNEFRERFEKRVFEANRMFGDTAKPGWKTDMGKIYILVGPPDEINKDIMARSHRGMIFWTYRRPPFPDLSANTVISFARDKTGEFVISTSPTIESDVARGLNYVKNMQKDIDENVVIPGRRDPALLAQGVPLNQTPLDTLLIAGRMQMLPPAEEEMFKAFATTREFYENIPLETRLDFYKSGDGSTYTTVTVGIKSTAVQYRASGGKEVPDVVVFGKLVNKDDPGLVFPLAGDGNFAESDRNKEAEIEDLLVFQATGGIKPGRYQLVLGIQDRVSRKISAYRKDVVIPDYTGSALSLSSIALAESMEPTEYRASQGKPFFLGKFKVVPKPNAVFRKSEELNLYFQVYNPAADPATGKPKFDVEYRFQVKETDGSFADMGTYAVRSTSAQVQGYAVPLEKWPAGEYRVVVVVKDLVSGASARNEAAFTLRG